MGAHTNNGNGNIDAGVTTENIKGQITGGKKIKNCVLGSIFLLLGTFVLVVYSRIMPRRTVTNIQVPAIASWQYLKSTNQSKRILHASEMPMTLSPSIFDKKGVDPRFARKVSKEEREIYMTIFKKFHDVFVKNNMTYFMYSGTLLGSYKYWGFIPWDDDVDVMIPWSLRKKTLKVLKIPGFDIIPDQGLRWKFDMKKSSIIRKGLTWRWPFLDLTFYKEDSKSLWDSDTGNYRKFKYEKEWVFPLTMRPFESFWFYSPKEPELVLKHTWDISKCATGTWNHRHEHSVSKRYSESCDKFSPFYAMVQRETTGKGKTIESLTMNALVLQRIKFDIP